MKYLNSVILKYSIKYYAGLIFTVFFLFACKTLSAQSLVTGKVVDKQGGFLAFSNVSLFSNIDSSFVKGEVIGDDGSFRFLALAPGSYYCIASMVGLKPNIIPSFMIDGMDTKIDLGTIVLSENLILKEVEILGRKAMIEVHADKIVFNVASSPSLAGNNGLDLLRKAPGVTVDMDNNVQLLGKSGVQIYINGRPSRLSGTDLANLLQNLNADNIEDIDIISNPSSRYEAEGDAGIININLKRNTVTGFNGNASSTISQGIYFRNNQSLALNYGGERIKASINLSRTGQESIDNFLDLRTQNGFTLDLNSKELQALQGYNMVAGIETDLGKGHSLNLSGNYVSNQNNNNLNSTTVITFPDTFEIDQVLKSQTLLKKPSMNLNLNLNYIWVINKTSSLSSDLSFGRYSTEGATYQPNTFFEADLSTLISTSNNRFYSNTFIDMWSAKLDYTKSWAKSSLSVGTKFADISTDNRFDFFNIINELEIEDINKSNDFLYVERVMAIYAIVDRNLGKFTKVSAGIRMENTDSRGRLISAQEIDNTDVQRNYTNFFPNIGLSYSDNKTHSISLGIGQRISRPNYQNLNPFVQPLSELSAWKGNPFLLPSYTTNFQLVYGFKQKLTITNSYSQTTNFFANIFEATGEKSTVIIPRNMQDATDYRISISYPLEVNKYWEFITFLDGGHKTFNGNIDGTIINLSQTTWSYRVQNSFKLPLGINLELTYLQYSDWIWRGSIRVRGNKQLYFGLKKDFLKDRLQVRVNGSDVLHTDSDYYYNGNYGGMMIDGVRTFDNQRLGLSATWKFGNQKLKTRSKSKGGLDDELQRLEGGG